MKIVAWPAGGGNPYTNLLYTHLKALGAEVVDFSPLTLLRSPGAIWHLHWPERMLNRPNALAAGLRAAAVLVLAFLARRRKTKLVWTVHNLSPHEHDHRWVGWWFWPMFIRQLSGFIALTAVGKQLVEQRHPGLRRIPGFIVPHGHYREAYPDTVSRDDARAALGLPFDAPIAAFVGYIRPYKNVPELIGVFRRIQDERARLLIAGQPIEPTLGGQLTEAACRDPRVHLFLDFLPDQKIQQFLRAADLVVLPFSEILNSGSALLALSFDRPILVPRVGALAELEREIGSEWVQGYTGALTRDRLAKALENACNRPLGRCEALNQFGWESVARKTWEAFQVFGDENLHQVSAREQASA